MKRYRPPPELGSQAFGSHRDGKPTGSAAVGGPDADDPLRGALLFGNDPAGGPRGSESFGGADADLPLRGALLFGNDPQGGPRGSESFGGADVKQPLRGALLFGNDPEGEGRGSESVGVPTQALPYRGSQSFGAPQNVPEPLAKDTIGYDFLGTTLVADALSLAGVRKDGHSRMKQRLVKILGRALAIEGERLRHGLGEDAIPWGRMKRESRLSRPLAEALRKEYSRAPGGVLGIAQTQAVLVEQGYMHTADIACEWDTAPMRLQVSDGAPKAEAISRVHKEHRFFVLKGTQGEVLGYVDCLLPHQREQLARVRNAQGATLARLVLEVPSAGHKGAALPPFRARIEDPSEKRIAVLREQQRSPKAFVAEIFLPGEQGATDLAGEEMLGESVGLVRDELTSGKVRAHVELDLPLHHTIAWGLALVMADVARLRRAGWPAAPTTGAAEEPIESIEEALGPRRGGPR